MQANGASCLSAWTCAYCPTTGPTTSPRRSSHAAVERRCARHAAALSGLDVVIGGNHPSNMVAARAGEGVRSLWACMEPSRRLYPRETLPVLSARLDAVDPSDDCSLMRAMRPVMSGKDAGVVVAQRQADRDMVPDIERITAISETSAASVQRIYGRVVDEVIYPTVNQPLPSARAPGIAADGLRVLTHGRVDLLKNVETVMRGFAQFRFRRSGRHELNIVGTGSDEVRLGLLARDLGITHVVKFHGFLGDVALRRLYERCDVMAAVPVDEPFGMVFPEAALHGLLLVGPDHGGPFEILDGGALGRAVDAFAPDQLSAALDEVWGLSYGEAERRRGRAYDACLQRYAPEVTLPAFERQVRAVAAVAR